MEQEEVRRELEETLSRLQELIDESPKAVAQFVTGPTRIDEDGQDVPSALGVVVGSEFLETGSGRWLLLQQFNTPETLYYAVRKMVGTPGLQRTLWAGQSVYVGNSAIKLIVTLQREVDETTASKIRCEAVMDSVIEKPANVPVTYGAMQLNPEDVLRVEQFIDERCQIIPGAKTARGPWSNAYNAWAAEQGYPVFGGQRNSVLSSVLARVIRQHGLEADANVHIGNTNYITGIVVDGVQHTVPRGPRLSSRGNLLPVAGTIDGTIYEYLSERAPHPQTAKDITSAVIDALGCEAVSVRNRCSQMAAAGTIKKAAWGQGYFVPELEEPPVTQDKHQTI